MAGNARTGGEEARVALVATIAVSFGLGSSYATLAGVPIIALLAAWLAIGLGFVGVAVSISPRATAAIMSLVAIGLGGLGIVLALLGLVGLVS